MAVPDAEADGDPTAEDVPIVPALPPYSQFSLFEKRLIIFMISFAATFSPLSSFIFFPAIDSLSQSLHVSIEKINLTVTSYLIVAGIAPAVIGDMADMTGRRIVYLLTMAIYCSANIGLALQSSWTALFILRMVQSAGSAATIAIGYGVVSDIASPSERGGFVGALVIGPNMAFAVGPVVAGALVQHAGWRWVFWLLAISSGSCLLLIALFLPETSRFIVGNGSRKTSALYRTIYSLFKCSRSHPQDVSIVLEKEGEEDVPARKFHIPNPLTSLKLLWAKDTVILTVIYGLFYTNMSCLQASLSTLFIKIYGISEFQSGLTYMPFGVGACLGGYCAGTIMNHDYRVTARRYAITIDTVGGDDLTTFPIQKARFRSIWYSISVAGAGTAGYGWALHSKVHMAVPLILQFIVGFSTTTTYNMCGTLLTDLHPKSPAAAQATNNIVRCSLAGAGLALLQVVLDAVGTGWTFTIIAGLLWGCLVLAWLEYTYGKAWSERMRERGVER